MVFHCSESDDEDGLDDEDGKLILLQRFSIFEHKFLL